MSSQVISASTTLNDPTTPGQRAAVQVFHNADNQTFPATTYGLLTGGVAQTVNPAGTLDRQRSTGVDAIPAAGVATGTQQLAGPALTTTFNGAITGSANAQTITVASTTNMKVGDIVTTSDNVESAEVATIPSGTTFTATLTKNHGNGAQLSWYHYNQARDTSAGDGQSVGIEAAGVYLYNGASQDRQRGNIDTAALITASGATTGQTGADQTNYNGRGVIVVLNMTSAGTGSVTLTIQGKDAASGAYYTLLAGAAVTTNSTNVYTVYPGAPATANVSANTPLPRTWRVITTANNANPTTFTVGASVIL